MTGVYIALTVVVAYLLGSLPSAYLIGRWRKGTDIREIGTRNMGAMNAFYNVGFWWGALVLLLDIGKGAAAVGIACAFNVPEIVRYFAGLTVVLGHSFPVFLRFRGGKGGATCLGVLYVLMPWGIPVTIVVFGVVLLISRFPTLSYSVALLSFPVLGWFSYGEWELTVFSIVLLMVPFFRYIPRLREMRVRAGNWGRVFHRTNLQDRF